MKKLFYLFLLVLTFSCDSDDGDTTIDTSQIVGAWTLNTIDISRVTIDGIDMTDDPLFSEMDVEEIDDSFDGLEESTFNLMRIIQFLLQEVKVILLLITLAEVN